MRRRLLPAVVLAALMLAVIGAVATPAPQRLPSIALGAVVVWRVELAVIVFVAIYGAIVATRLALHGETLTRIGRDGIEIPRVGSARAEEGAGDEDLATSVAKLQAAIAGLGQEPSRREDPSDLLLRTRREDS
jgi:hypothetical protein